jgi:hypothetical protein
MCWTSNHQNNYRNGPRAHFPFNLPIFGDLCQHIKKQLKCNIILKSVDLKTKFSHLVFGIFGSLLPSLGLFFANQIIFPISKSNTLVWANREMFQE